MTAIIQDEEDDFDICEFLNKKYRCTACGHVSKGNFSSDDAWLINIDEGNWLYQCAKCGAIDTREETKGN